jgi:membrane protein Man1
MSVEALSDSELRTKLFEYGYSVGPVTQTTRNILVKKLKTLMELRGASGSRHSMAARYNM